MRRANLIMLGTIVLLGTLLIGGGRFVAAQDASADFTGHPLVGAWLLDTDTEDPENSPSNVFFSSDGVYLQSDIDGVVVGAWEPTGDATASLTFSEVDVEEGTFTVRASIEVSSDGQTLTATYTLEVVDSSGESPGEYGPGTAEGTRMVVEGPGDPVGSFEDFFGGFEGTPEATPES